MNNTLKIKRVSDRVELPEIKYRFRNSKHYVYCYYKGVYYEESIGENLMNQLYIESLEFIYPVATLSTKLYRIFTSESHNKMDMNFASYLANKYIKDMQSILGEN